MKRITISAILFSICFLGRSASAAEPPKPPELKVLERFVGTWDCEVITKPALWTPKKSRMKAVEVNEMALDGWFLHGCSKTPEGKTLAVLMNTYDPAQKIYRIWRFAGKGCEALTGTWDEASSTLMITTDLGNRVTTKAAFHLIDADHREYNISAKDSDGKVYMDIHGTVTRRK